MPEESNYVAARTAVRIPAEYCFNIDNTPGVEDLYLVFSRNQEDVNNLNSTIKSSHDGTAAEAAAAPSGIGVEMARLEHLQSRDLTVKKVAKPMNAQEPAHSVYVVYTGNTPSDRLVTQIQLKH